MSQTTLLVLLSAAAVISAALSFLAWARVVRPPRRAQVEDEEADSAVGPSAGTAEQTDAETDDNAEDRDDPDIAT